MTKVLVTRPEGPARDSFVKQLETRGHETGLLPLTSFEQVDFEISNQEPYQAIVFTSGEAVRRFPAGDNWKDLACYTVGDATAALARNAGFGQVNSANGDVNDLAHLLICELAQEKGKVLYPRGEKVAADLSGLVADKGLKIDEVIVYRTTALEVWPKYIKFDLSGGAFEAVTFLSPLAAEIFTKLVSASEDSIDHGCARAICMSTAVANKLDQKAWASIEIADRPTTESLIGLL